MAMLICACAMRASAQIMRGEPTMKYILWIALLCLLLAGSTNISARTITAGHTTDADYWTIQEAVDAADPSGGDTVRVMIGTYNEDVVISKSLVLLNNDKDRTIIDYDGVSGIVVLVTVDNVTIRGFTIQGGSTGVQINGNNSTVTDNRIRNVGIE